MTRRSPRRSRRWAPTWVPPWGTWPAWRDPWTRPWSSCGSGAWLFDDRLHALERRAHAVVIGLAPQASEQRPVDPRADVLREPEVLGDVCSAVRGLQPVAPGIDRAPRG